MPSSSYVFDRLHGGEPLDLSTEPKAPDPAATKKALQKSALKDEDVRDLEKLLHRVRSESDRAIMLAVHRGGLGFPGGMAAWSMLCLLDPDGVAEHFSLIADATIRDYKTLFSGIAGLADTIMAAADDQGTQQTTILPPSIFRTLYVPAYRRMNDALHRADPTIKSFLHSCGAIYDLIPDVAAAGFDALNPVQWCAGGHGYAEWKSAAAAQKLALWGGGINTQATLPLGSVQDVEKEAAAVASVLSKGSGWIFCAIHNLLAEIPPEKIIALYRSV
jgi:uroporphyrinogen decarboxylase